MKINGFIISLGLLIIMNSLANAGDVQIQNRLEEILIETKKKANLVGVGAVIIQGGDITAEAVSGFKKKGQNETIELNNSWHIGSITKSITATMIARLVEHGELTFDLTLGKAFPHMSDQMHEDWRSVTISQLLTHTAGVKANPHIEIFTDEPKQLVARMNQRREIVEEMLLKKPKRKPGKKFAYSNMGYITASVVAEKVTDLAWEELVKKHVFNPLNLNSAGFGSPRGNDPMSQPWGHKSIFGTGFFKGSFSPNDPKADLNPIVGPAGLVHMTIQDLALYGYEHIQGEQGKSNLLTAESFKTLHSSLPAARIKVGWPPRRRRVSYAYGWIIHDKLSKKIDSHTMWHNGSDGRWYSLLVLVPDIDTAFAFITNDGSLFRAEKAFLSAIEKLILKMKP